jgi:hypothetical protein
MFDILLLLLLAIALALIIGISIVYVVDKKLNDIRINVPACPVPVCPEPICPKLSNINISESEQEFNQVKEGFKTMKEGFQTMALAANEGADLDMNYKIVPREIGEDGIFISNDPINPNGRTIDPLVLTQDFGVNDANTGKHSVLLRQGYSGSPSDTYNKGDSITYPSADDTVRYNGDGCYRGNDVRYIRKLEEKDLITTSCRPYTDTATKEGSFNKIRARMMTAGSNSANYVVDENIIFYVPKLYMGRDPTISGISYAQMNIENPADIDQIGSIPVDDYNGEPVPVDAYNYN